VPHVDQFARWLIVDQGLTAEGRIQEKKQSFNLQNNIPPITWKTEYAQALCEHRRRTTIFRFAFSSLGHLQNEVAF